MKTLERREKTVVVELSRKECRMLASALDAYAYWELSSEDERSSGFSLLAGDTDDLDEEQKTRKKDVDKAYKMGSKLERLGKRRKKEKTS